MAAGDGGMDSRSNQVAEVSAKYLAKGATNTVPVGYKQTEVGVIPNHWEASTIGDVTIWVSGGTPSRKNGAFWTGSIPWISGSTLKSLEIYTSEQFLTEQAVECGSKMAPLNATLLLVRGSALHTEIRAGLVVASVCFNQDVKALIPNKSVYPKYLTIYLLAMKSELLKLVSSAGNSAGVLDTQLVQGFKFLKPPLSEQTAIANALSAVDALISELEKLIAKKQAIKTATMQQLLTGRTRLPQFALREDGSRKDYKQSVLGEIPEDWELREIGDFAPLQRGFDLPSWKRKDGDYPVVYSNGIANKHEKFQVKGPGVVTGRSGTLGKVHFVEGYYWPHNTSLWVTKFDNSDPKYVYYIFIYIDFERFASGSGVPTLNRNDAHCFKVTIPSAKEEQASIATILSNMDEEIQALQQCLTKTRQIKQGMMQELLTGKTRLLKPAGSAA